MNQQIKQLQQAKKLLNKARGEAERAQSIIRRSRGDLGLCKEVSRAVDGLRRTTLSIDQQCARIDRKLCREDDGSYAAIIDGVMVGIDRGSPDGDSVVQVTCKDGNLHVEHVTYEQRHEPVKTT